MLEHGLLDFDPESGVYKNLPTGMSIKPSNLYEGEQGLKELKEKLMKERNEKLQKQKEERAERKKEEREKKKREKEIEREGIKKKKLEEKLKKKAESAEAKRQKEEERKRKRESEGENQTRKRGRPTGSTSKQSTETCPTEPAPEIKHADEQTLTTPAQNPSGFVPDLTPRVNITEPKKKSESESQIGTKAPLVHSKGGVIVQSTFPGFFTVYPTVHNGPYL